MRLIVNWVVAPASRCTARTTTIRSGSQSGNGPPDSPTTVAARAGVAVMGIPHSTTRDPLQGPAPPPGARGASDPAQLPRLRPQERGDPLAREGDPEARRAAPGPGKPWAHPVAAVPVGGARVHAGEESLGAGAIGGVDGGGQPVGGVVHQRDGLVVGADA